MLQTIKGMLSELLDAPPEPKPYSPPRETGRSYDHNGYAVIHIEAANYAEAARLTDGYTIEGPVHKALVHVGNGRWEARVQCDDKVWR